MNATPALVCVFALLSFSPVQAQGYLSRGGEDPTQPLQRVPVDQPVGPIVDSPAPGFGGCGLGGPIPMQRPSADLTVWSFWWEYNKTPYLAAISQNRRMTPFVFGPSGTGVERQWLPTHSDLFDRVQPALLQFLQGETNDGVISSTLISLAKIGVDTHSPDLIALFSTYLDDEAGEIAEAATLALGILEDHAAVGILTDLVMNTEAGRLLTDSAFVPLRTQVFAAASLGIIGAKTSDEEVRRMIFATLRFVYESGTEHDRDTMVMAVMSMGLVPFRSPADRAQQVDLLLGYFQDLERSHYVRCHAAASICRLLEGSNDKGTKERALEVFLDVLGSKAKKVMLSSSVVAIGKLADNDADGIGARSRAALMAVPRNVTDTQTRNLSLLALAEVGGRNGAIRNSAEVREVANYFSLQMRRGKNAVRPWAAIAAGLMIAALDTDAPAKLVEALEEELLDERTPRVGAYAIGAALSGRMDFEHLLLAKFELIQDDQAKGDIALALAMLGVDAATELIAVEIEESQYRPLKRSGLAMALGLMSEDSPYLVLLRQLDNVLSQSTLASLAQAIGNLRDRRSITELIEFAGGETHTYRSRAGAIQALGILGDKSRTPWHALFATGFNYRASTHSLTEVVEPGLLRFL